MRTQLGSSELALFVQNRSAKSHSRPTAPKFAHQAQHPTCLGGFVGVAYFFGGPRDGVSMSISPGCGAGPVQGQRFGCYRQIPVPNSGQHAENVQVRQKNRLPSLASRVCFWAQGAPKGAPPVIFSCPTTVVPPPCPIPAPLVKRDGPVFGRSGPVPGATGGCGCVPSLPQVP